MKIKTNVHNPEKKSFTIVRDAKPGFGAGHSNNLVGVFFRTLGKRSNLSCINYFLTPKTKYFPLLHFLQQLSVPEVRFTKTYEWLFSNQSKMVFFI